MSDPKSVTCPTCGSGRKGAFCRAHSCSPIECAHLSDCVVCTDPFHSRTEQPSLKKRDTPEAKEHWGFVEKTSDRVNAMPSWKRNSISTEQPEAPKMSAREWLNKQVHDLILVAGERWTGLKICVYTEKAVEWITLDALLERHASHSHPPAEEMISHKAGCESVTSNGVCTCGADHCKYALMEMLGEALGSVKTMQYTLQEIHDKCKTYADAPSLSKATALGIVRTVQELARRELDGKTQPPAEVDELPEHLSKQMNEAIDKAYSVGAFKILKNAEAAIGRWYWQKHCEAHDAKRKGEDRQRI